MTHLHYKPNLIRLYNIAVKHGLVKPLAKKQRTPASLAACVGVVYRTQPELANTMEALIHAEEFAWLSAGQQVYFFEDAAIAEGITRGSHRINDIGALYQGNESFVLMLPDDMRLGDSPPCSGALVTVFNHVERADAIIGNFWRAMGHRPPNVAMDNESSPFVIHVAYQQGGHDDLYYRVAIPANNLAMVLRFETIEQYRDYMDETNHFDYFGGMNDLSEAELRYQFELLRLVAGFLVYRVALPERIRAGLPRRADSPGMQFALKPSVRTLYAPRETTGFKSVHYRSWHFRQLTAPRYYQGEHKDKPPGSRIVFVSDALVGGDTAETAT